MPKFQQNSFILLYKLDVKHKGIEMKQGDLHLKFYIKTWQKTLQYEPVYPLNYLIIQFLIEFNCVNHSKQLIHGKTILPKDNVECKLELYL